MGEEAGWHYGFSAAGVGMVIGLCIYLYGLRHLPPDAKAQIQAKAAPAARLSREERRSLLVLLVLFVPSDAVLGGL